MIIWKIAPCFLFYICAAAARRDLISTQKGTDMNITGIIAEYNPFHNGHAYHLAQAKKETHADYLIVILSGNFVQRGAPALLDKFVRAKMALLEGADLVIELPPLWSCASAEYFAGAGIALLRQLGCVNALSYGCETPSAEVFDVMLDLLSQEPPLYQQQLASAQKRGLSYAAARENALLSLLPDTMQDAARSVLRNPNNILALEYQKAIAKQAAPIKVRPILRLGAGYHCTRLSGPLASASAIRSLIASQCEDSNFQKIPKALRQAMPPSAFALMTEYHSRYPFLYENDCSQMLHYALLKNAADGFSMYADCSLQLSRKICGSLEQFDGYSSFCTQLKSKDIAYTRISRVLSHILLDIQKSDYELWRSRSYVPYAKVLGFRRESRGLLAHLKKHSFLPLLTRTADVKKLLSDEERLFYEKQSFADTLYRAIVFEKGRQKMPHETRQQIVIV